MVNMGAGILLEVAVANVERARAAERAGARRIELCEQLEAGGITPSLELVRQVRAAVRLPLQILIRPRSGNFIYTPMEFSAMKSQIEALRDENVQGIVTGVLQSNHSVDIDLTRELVEAASPLEVTFHRAFDETPDLLQSLEAVILTGSRRVLTSGGKSSAADSLELLRQLINRAGARIHILPGGGLHAGNMALAAQIPGVCELHTGLGNVVSYDDPDISKFESALRACVAVLQQLA